MLQEDGEGVREAAEKVARRSYGKLVAFLAARTGDVAGAEDALSDAFAAALADWPSSGIPDRPEAWLMTTALRKVIDVSRRQRHRENAVAHQRRPEHEGRGRQVLRRRSLECHTSANRRRRPHRPRCHRSA